MKEQKWVYEGLITESLPNGMFRVRLDNEDLNLGYISGKIRCSFIRILPGDRVKIEVSRYDSTKGRIIYRPNNKDSNDKVTFSTPTILSWGLASQNCKRLIFFQGVD